VLHIGTLATYATNWLGPENIRQIRARVMGISWPGDRLHYAGAVSKIHEVEGQRMIDLALTCTRQTGERTLDVAMSFLAPA
jgi:hypothetical protein